MNRRRPYPPSWTDDPVVDAERWDRYLEALRQEQEDDEDWEEEDDEYISD